MDFIHALGYAGAVLTGLILGLLGGGGALMSIPVLVYLFHIEASVATGYSLFLIGVTASIGALQTIRHKLVDAQAVLYYGIPSVITVYSVRRFLIPNLPNNLFAIGSYVVDKNHFILFLLSVVMVIAGYKMIVSQEPEQKELAESGIDRIKLPIYAVFVGAFLGLVGAGGGFLMIPALVYFGNLPMKRAVGTSIVLVAINSFIGFLGDVHSSQHMDWKFLFLFSAFSVTGVFGGFYLQNKIDGTRLKKYFGGFMMAMALFIMVKETFKIL